MSKAIAKSHTTRRWRSAVIWTESRIDVMRLNSQGKVVVLTAGFQAVEASLQAAS